MPLSVLEIAQRFCKSAGLPVVTTINGASIPAGDMQLAELINEEGRALSRRHDWQVLTYEATFTTLAAESQGTIASIIGATQDLRRIVNDTIWNRTTKQPIYGPVSRQEWQARKALSTLGPFPEFRIRGNTLRFIPTPTAGQSCYFEYVSTRWLVNAAGTTYSVNIGVDTDVPLLDDELILAGLNWRWRRAKGLSYGEEFASYEEQVVRAIGDDGGKRVLQMDGMAATVKPGVFVPVGSWPL